MRQIVDLEQRVFGLDELAELGREVDDHARNRRADRQRIDELAVSVIGRDLIGGQAHCFELSLQAVAALASGVVCALRFAELPARQGGVPLLAQRPQAASVSSESSAWRCWRSRSSWSCCSSRLATSATTCPASTDLAAIHQDTPDHAGHRDGHDRFAAGRQVHDPAERDVSAMLRVPAGSMRSPMVCSASLLGRNTVCGKRTSS